MLAVPLGASMPLLKMCVAVHCSVAQRYFTLSAFSEVRVNERVVSVASPASIATVGLG
jgi:hypothetical protein